MLSLLSGTGGEQTEISDFKSTNVIADRMIILGKYFLLYSLNKTTQFQ
ncbi:hypothetical protein XBKB1_1600002 [Xenorhabdus bovienii str. kraussei Becker Underwood]|uniref:Uncharacterized protein n=1 Tax=Xenorhabdus bovienii str. kraussei Becker Underwood TaxID=1398204 RepID=A0A077PQC0_XENBV|nr:hypothetical protein XBKB1_1600002 [Xenorhabdus bovienii str. kraussei Becker Underwood]